MIACADENSILEEIAAAPEDTERRLIYADWLEERGDIRCEFVRSEIELERLVAENDRKAIVAAVTRLRRLGVRLDKSWKRRVMKARTSEIVVALDSLSYSRLGR